MLEEIKNHSQKIDREIFKTLTVYGEVVVQVSNKGKQRVINWNDLPEEVKKKLKNHNQ